MVSPILKQSWTVTAVLLNMLGEGMVLSYATSLNPALKSPNARIKTDLETLSWLSSCVGLACMPGFFLSSWLMNVYGRKISHALVIVPAVMGWLLIYFGTNVPTLMVGRILGGVTGGATVALGAVIIGEYTSPCNRGMFLNLKTASVCLGNTLVHILAHFYEYTTVALIAIVPHVIAIAIVLTWPESPAWLASKHQYEKSEAAFYWLRGKSKESTEELNKLIQSQMNRIKPVQKEESTCGVIIRCVVEFFKKFTRKDFLKPLFIIFFAGALLEACGRHIFPAYALDMLERITGNKSQSFYYTLGIDLITTISASMSSVLVKLFKRRTLLFWSGGAGLAVLFAICLYLYLQANAIISRTYSWIPVSMLAFYFILANLGCTPIPLALLGEIWPLAHRSIGSSVSGVTLSIFLMVALKITPSMLVHLDFHGTFAVFGTGMGLSLVGLFFLLPETKDKTLQEIEDYFNYGRFLEDDKKENDEAKIKMIS